MDFQSKKDVKKYLLEYYKDKLNRSILEKNIDDLVDEFIENKKFIKENGSDIESLPNKESIKWWFQERPKQLDNEERLYEINVDEICLTNKAANDIFLSLYKYSFSQGTSVPKTIEGMVKLNKIAEYSTNKKTKQHAKNILSNIAVVGIIRFYHLECKPYLTEKQITEAIAYFRKCLFVIEEVNKGTYSDKIVEGSLYIFDYLNKNPYSDKK